MLITREMLIKQLSDDSGYYQKDIRAVLQSLDRVILQCFDNVTEEEEVSVQLVKGIKCGCKVMPKRTRKDPRSQEDIVCDATVKPFAKFSDDFRLVIQEQYDAEKDG